MRILYLSHRFPYPPTDGARIRSFNMIKHLGQRHDVTVASIVRSPEEASQAKGIAAYCARVETHTVTPSLQVLRMLACLPTSSPASMGYFYSRGLATRIRDLLAKNRFDLIFVHCSSVAQYVEDVPDVPKIIDFCDMDAQKWLDYVRHTYPPRSLGYWLEGVKLKIEERRIANRFDFCTVATRAEQQTLDGYGIDTPTDWFPNGVDTEYFAPSDEAYDADTITFIGRMNYFPNEQCMTSFCEQTLPLIRRVRPQMKLIIVGADPPKTVRRLGELPGVTVTGTVTDVRPFVRGSVATVAPLTIARGTQNKILEAMALGVPVIASRIAAGGVDALEDEHLLVGSSPQEFAELVLRLAEDPGERERLAQAGRARVLSHHAWDASMQRLDAIIERCVTRHNARPVQSSRRAALL